MQARTQFSAQEMQAEESSCEDSPKGSPMGRNIEVKGRGSLEESVFIIILIFNFFVLFCFNP